MYYRPMYQYYTLMQFYYKMYWCRKMLGRKVWGANYESVKRGAQYVGAQSVEAQSVGAKYGAQIVRRKA